jgi:uncharacterized protein (TIGR00288 family)
MNGRHTRTPASSPASRTQGALIHRGPGAIAAATHSIAAPFVHAPNAALLIDFDNVTMGIRSDLGKELRTLLSSEIIKGKVAVQRAYADWRRYPQYIVPLSEASIDLIFAPAYGSSKKNATDIRLAIDALELVFTRPEIGTFILLSGDSDFSSLVIKLKEYGKYVIGVGIRESSSDLLVQNCDEYYSYNALAGLVKANEDEPARKFDPWELVSEAVTRMKRNGDVMRSDRLKQVMQDIDPGFDEKNLGMSKFSRFVHEAHQRGLLSMTKLENGQLEIGLPLSTHQPAPATEVRASSDAETVDEATASEGAQRTRETTEPADEREERARRSRRGRGRGRGRDREDRVRAAAPAPEIAAVPDVPAPLQLAEEPAAGAETIGVSGERQRGTRHSISSGVPSRHSPPMTTIPPAPAPSASARGRSSAAIAKVSMRECSSAFSKMLTTRTSSTSAAAATTSRSRAPRSPCQSPIKSRAPMPTLLRRAHR